MKIIDAMRDLFVNLLPHVTCLRVFSLNFIFSNFKFQVEILLHNNCAHVGLVDLVILAYMFTNVSC